MLFFALTGSDELGRSIAQAGGFEVAPHEEREFDGGESKARPLVSVRGEDVYILHNLNGVAGASANDKLVRLLLFIAACKENGASSVTAIVPYLAYSRKDRQTKPRDPVSTRYIAQLFEAVGTDRVMTLDVHNFSAFQNAFRCQSIHLNTRRVFARELVRHMPSDRFCVVSPDGGGVKRAQLFREMLEGFSGIPVGYAFMEKRRSGGVVSGTLFAGDVEGADALILDDMIVGGGTMLRAAEACKARGATSVHAIATHALFSPDFAASLANSPIDGLMVSDSVAPINIPEDVPPGRVRIVSVGPLIAEAIDSLTAGGSIGDLLGE